MSLRLGAVKSCRDYRSKAECSILAKGKNAKKLQMESMQNVSRSGEKGRTASLWLVGESRILYVGIRESMKMF